MYYIYTQIVINTPRSILLITTHFLFFYALTLTHLIAECSIISLSGLMPGTYLVKLLINGTVVDSKNLLKQ